MCSFSRDRIEVLGRTISQRKVETEPNKTERITNARVPRNKKELRSFLMFCSFYRRFVNGFAHSTAPLHELSAGKTQSIWSDEAS